MSDLSGSVPVTSTDVGGAIVGLTAMAAQVTRQPAFPSVTAPELQNLNSHLITAQGHANAWINTISGDLWNRLQGMVTFGETFGHLEDDLLAAAQAMGDEKAFAPNEIAKLIAMLEALQTLVQQQATQTQTAFGELTTYRTEVSADYAQFLTDFQTANRVLGGDDGAIARLTDKISSEHSAMSKDLAMIGGGAAMMVVGILIIAVGALAEFVTAGAATVVVAVGIGVVAAGAAMTGVAGADYDAKLGQIAQDELTLAQDNAEITLLHGVATQLTGLTTTLDQAQKAMQNMVTAWQELDNSIGAVVADLQNPEDYLATVQQHQPEATPATVSIIITAEIKTAADDWASAVTLAQSYIVKGRNVVFVDTGKALPTQDAIVAAVAASGHPAGQARLRMAVA